MKRKLKEMLRRKKDYRRNPEAKSVAEMSLERMRKRRQQEIS